MLADVEGNDLRQRTRSRGATEMLKLVSTSGRTPSPPVSNPENDFDELAKLALGALKTSNEHLSLGAKLH